MNLQHVNAKLLVRNPEEVDLELLVPIFHCWIQNRVTEELLLDVADYRHVEAGPGVVLIGHQANYSVDNTEQRLGVRYNRKAAFDGSNQDRLKQATRAALIACQRLEAEPSLQGALRFNGRDIEISVNDRLLAPNDDATRQAVDEDLRAFFRELFGGSEYSLSYDTSDPRRLFSVSAKATRDFAVEELLGNLTAAIGRPTASLR
jgi:hypothetical protein